MTPNTQKDVQYASNCWTAQSNLRLPRDLGTFEYTCLDIASFPQAASGRVSDGLHLMEGGFCRAGKTFRVPGRTGVGSCSSHRVRCCVQPRCMGQQRIWTRLRTVILFFLVSTYFIVGASMKIISMGRDRAHLCCQKTTCSNTYKTQPIQAKSANSHNGQGRSLALSTFAWKFLYGCSSFHYSITTRY